MNKKGDIMMVIMPIIFLIVMFTLLFVMIQIQYESTAKQESCDYLGMEHKEGGRFETFDYCIDPFGEAHYADVECKGIWRNSECKANIVTIGDNRVIIK